MKLFSVGIARYIALVLLVVALPLYAAKSDHGREAYQVILSAYESHDWQRTVDLADQFRKNFPKSEREGSLLLIKAESHLRLRELDEAGAAAAEIVVRFPETDLVSRAKLVTAEVALLAGRWEVAETNLGWIISFSGDDDVAGTARQRLAELHDYQESQKKAGSKAVGSDSLKVVLLLPMTGSNSAKAEQFLQGFLLPWREAGFEHPSLFDTGGDPVRAARLFTEVRRDYAPWIVVGGIDTPEAAVLAAASQYLETSFLTTACGDEGLAALSSYALQGRPDYASLGAHLGRFAAVNMGLHNLAVFAVESGPARQFASGFISAAGNNGARVITDIRYYPGSNDHSSYLSQLKRDLVHEAFTDSLQDQFYSTASLTLNGVVYSPGGKDLVAHEVPSIEGFHAGSTRRLAPTFLDSIWNESEQSVRRWMEASGHDVDSAAIEVLGLDGLLVVVEPGSIEMIAPQLARYRLTKQLLGNEAWGDRDALRKVRSYVEGMVYTDPHAPADDSCYAVMVVAASQQSGSSVSTYHFAGDRAARMIISAAGHSGGRDRIHNELSTLYSVPTLSGPVTLVKEERVDQSSALILFKDGQWTRVGY